MTEPTSPTSDTAPPPPASSADAAPAASPPRRPWPRAARVAAYTVGGVAGLGVAVWAAVPLIVPRVVAGTVSEMLGRPVSLARVSFQPWSLSLELGGLKLAGRTPDAPPQFELEQLSANLAWSTLWRGGAVVESVTVKGPRIRLARTGEGRYDIDDLIARVQALIPPPDPNAKPAKFAVHNVTLEGGEFLFDDQPKQRQHRISDLRVGVPFVANLSAQDIATVVQPHLALTLDGTPLALDAKTTPFAADKASELQLKLGAFDLAALQPYVPASVPLKLKQGTLALDLGLRFAAPLQQAPQVGVSGTIELAQLAVTDRQDADLARLGLLRVQMADVQPLNRQIGLEAVLLDDVLVDVQRAGDGSLNWLRALQTAPAPAAAGRAPAASAASAASVPASAPVEPATAPPAAPWAVTLQRLDMHHIATRWRDQTLQPAPDMTLDLQRLEARELRWPLAKGQAPATLQATLQLLKAPPPPTAASAAPAAHQGQIDLQAQVDQAGGSAQVEAQGWTPTPVAAYLSQWLVPRVEGTLGLSAQASWQGMPGAQPPAVKLNHLRLADVKVQDPQAPRATGWTGWKLFEVAGVEVDLAAQQVAVQRIALEQPQAWALRDAQGRLNVQRWVRTPPAAQQPASPPAAKPAAAPAQPWRVALNEFKIDGAQLHWRDEATPSGTPVALDVAPFNLNVGSVAWPAQAGRPMRVSGHLKLSPPGTEPARMSELNWRGQLDLAPLAWQGEIDLQRFSVPIVLPYVGEKLPVQLVRAEAGLKAKTQVSLPPSGPQVVLDGVVRLNDVLVRGAAAAGRPAEDWLAWRAFEVAGVTLDGAAHRVAVQRVTLAQPEVWASRDAQGQINLMRAVPPAAASQPAPAASGPVWRVQLDQFALEGARLHWRDAAAPGGAVALDVAPLDLNVAQVAWPAAQGTPIRVQGQLRIAPPGTASDSAGHLTWQGQLGLAPVAWQGGLTLQRLPVHALAPYAGKALPVEIVRAEAGLNLQTQVSLPPEGLRAQASGEVHLSRGWLRAPAVGQDEAHDLLSWEDIGLTGLLVALQPNQKPTVQLANGRLADVHLRVRRNAEGQLNLQALAGAGAASEPASAAAPAPAASASGELPVNLEVKQIELAGWRVDWRDQAVRPGVQIAALSEFGGRVGRFGTAVAEPAALQFQGRVLESGLLGVTGHVRPLAQPLAGDAQVTLNDLELSPLTPYSVRYIGQPIERGKLGLDLNNTLASTGQLTGQNRVRVDQLTLGRHNGDPEAANLPTGLALALLKDRHGAIDVSVPLSGSLHNPSFSVMGVLGQWFGGLMAKVVSAPFSLLSGGREEALDRVTFEAGQARLSPAAAGVVQQAAQALAQRPAVKVLVTGAADLKEGAGGSEARARQLALERAVSVRDALAAQGVARERVFVAPPDVNAQPGVQLTLQP
ncbi:DUF748 domain-containing protein [Vitreoscilla filiformis]|uniref:DUF748 domain-containing protein n=1 Tax=Vitreoscilla filiformis TaxID=63 RepID=UPI0018DF89BE|nr:DUF748 domain-containing protein [Vitreoscilla filiformis]